MSKSSQLIGIIRLVTLLMGGLGTVSAYAQTPTFSAPNLPPIPGAPAAPTQSAAAIPDAPGLVSAPARDTAIVTPPALSDLAPLPATATAETARLPQPQDEALADLPAPIAPETSDMVEAPAPADTPPILTEGEPPPFPPGPGTLPGVKPTDTAASTQGPALLAPPPLALPAPPMLPEIDVANEAPTPDKPQRKTWQTTLKPVSTAYDTAFNYRRVQLPSAIYRDQYHYENKHLPKRRTRSDYERLLFASAATNDINATRALLNAGTNINATNPRGETPLSVARRFGARDAAALLAARGAR